MPTQLGGGILSFSRHLSRTGYRSDYRTAPHHYGTLLTAKLTMTFWNVISQTSLHWDNGLHCHKSLEEENMTKKKKCPVMGSMQQKTEKKEVVLEMINKNLILTLINSQSVNQS